MSSHIVSSFFNEGGYIHYNYSLDEIYLTTRHTYILIATERKIIVDKHILVQYAETILNKRVTYISTIDPLLK